LVFLNFGKENSSVAIRDEFVNGTFINVFEGTEIKLMPGSEISIEPWAYRVLEKKQ
jgi:hypothetical protein